MNNFVLPIVQYHFYVVQETILAPVAHLQLLSTIPTQMQNEPAKTVQR